LESIGIVVTDGVGFRNFILSNFISESLQSFKKVIIYSGIPKSEYPNYNNPKVVIKELPIFNETKINWIFRKLKELAHSYLHRNYYGINDNLVHGYPKNNSFRAFQIKFIYLIANFFHKEKHIQKFEKWQFKSFQNNPIAKQYLELLKNDTPDILFFTHQRPPYIAPVLDAAQQLKIKTASFIFSWDNLASKGRMLGDFDYYLVWSELMKKELLHFYPTTKASNIEVVGTPQFEPYVMDEYEVSKDAFLMKFDLDGSKKIICYSCADAGIGGNDPIHIEAIMNYIKKSANEFQLLVRTSPAENGKRFDETKNKFSSIKWNIPKWKLTRNNHVESWSQRVPTSEDIIDLKSILKFSDVNANMCSTMSMDFMLFDKPVINTVFGNKENGLYNDQRFLNYDHYKYVINSNAVVIAKNEAALFTALDEAFNYPNKYKNERKQLLDYEIGKPLEGTSKRMVEALKEITV